MATSYVNDLMGLGMPPQLAALLAAGGSSGVSSFNTRTGAVTLTSGDVTAALGSAPATLAAVQTQVFAMIRDNGYCTLGDSTMCQNGAFSGSFELQLALTSPKGVLKLVHGGGAPGQTSTQIADRVMQDVVSHRPGFALIMMGTNNLGGGGGGISAVIPDLTRTVERIRQAGIACFVMPVLPSTANGANVLTLNASIASFVSGLNDPLTIYANYWSLVGNASNGQWSNAIYTLDGTHPSTACSRVVCAYLQNLIIPYLAPLMGMLRPVSGDLTYNPITNGTFDQGSPTAGLASGWAGSSITGTVTYAIVTPSAGDDLQGNWQQVTVAPNSGGGIQFSIAASNASMLAWANQRVTLSCRIRATGLDANVAAGGSGYFTMGFTDGSGASSSSPGGIGFVSGANFTADINPGVVGNDGFFQFDGYLSVQAGLATASFQLGFNNGSASPGNIVILLGEVSIFAYQNPLFGLTTGGLDAGAPPNVVLPAITQNVQSTASLTVLANTQLVGLGCNGASITVTLPSIASSTGIPKKFIRTDNTPGNLAILTPAGTDKIDGSTAALSCLGNQFDSITLVPGNDQFNSACWYVEDRVGQPRFVATATTTITNTTAATTLIPSGAGTVAFPANTLFRGRVLALLAAGIFSSAASPGNLTIILSLGGTTIAMAVITNLTALASALAWRLDAKITVQSSGSGGTVMVDGVFQFEGASNARLFWDMNNAGATTTINTTTAENMALTATWATASPSNSITTTTLALDAPPL